MTASNDAPASLRTARACQRSGLTATIGPMGAFLGRVGRGILRAVRDHFRVFVAVALTVMALSVLGPPLVLSLARRPVDYFTVNPWLKRLPAYVVSPTIPLAQKLDKLPDLALFWFSSDSPYGGVDWGFAVDVTDVGRILLLAGLFGAYFALVARRRSVARAAGDPGASARRGGLAGMLTSVVGLSTGPCSVMGCGAPVIPVVGLAFAGLSSGTLALLASLSRIATVVVFLGLAAGIAYLGWQTGDERRSPSRPAAGPGSASRAGE